MFPSASKREKSRSPFRPRLEILEDRTLLSICTVDRLTDSGQGSGLTGDLRYCITQAQDRDSIAFTVTGTINLTRPLPDLIHSMSIEGPGADLLTVRRSTGGQYRIFTVASGTMVSIDGLTIANGYAYGGSGGGISNAGTLTVNNSNFSGNSTDGAGGGISNTGRLKLSHSMFYGNFAGSGGGISNGGTLTIRNSTFSDNGAAYGGAIFNQGPLSVINSTLSGNFSGNGGGIANGGALTVINSTLSGNSASYSGGGIYNYSATAMLNVINSSFSSSSAGYGGGIFNVGVLNVINSSFSVNFAGYGGGIFNMGTLTVGESTFFNNSVGYYGGNGAGIYNYSASTMLIVINSTFSGNSARGGGGIFNNYGALTLSNCTFFGNFSTSIGGAIYNYYSASAILIVQDSTVSGNYSAGSGAGVANDGILYARNTIIAGNTAPRASDLSGNLGSLGHNLIGNTQGGSGFHSTDLLNTDPLLGRLRDNGGPTLTMALQCRSPAIDAGDNTDAPEWDQRGEGFPRIVNHIIDIGSYEVQKGECGGLAPHSSDRLNRLIPIELALDSPCVSISKVANVSADLEVKPIPPVSQSVAATPTPPERTTRPPASLNTAVVSLFLDPNLDCSFEKSLICS